MGDDQSPTLPALSRARTRTENRWPTQTELDQRQLVVDVQMETHAPSSTWRWTSNDRRPDVSAASGRSSPVQFQVTWRTPRPDKSEAYEPAVGATIFAHGAVRSGPRMKIAVQ